MSSGKMLQKFRTPRLGKTYYCDIAENHRQLVVPLDRTWRDCCLTPYPLYSSNSINQNTPPPPAPPPFITIGKFLIRNLKPFLKKQLFRSIPLTCHLEHERNMRHLSPADGFPADALHSPVELAWEFILFLVKKCLWGVRHIFR